MSFFVIVAIALGLAMDAFAVAIACSVNLRQISGRQIFRLAFHFGLFQAIMPIVGWLAGIGAKQYIESWDHWIAFGLLSFVGLKAILETFRESHEQKISTDPTKGISLIIFSIATSIDALAVGISLAMIDTDIFFPAFVIGIITAGITTLGMFIGSKVGSRFGSFVEVLGGLILIGIGIKIVISHLI